MQEASDSSTVASADTAPAGQDTLQQQKLSGNYRKHHLRYDLRLNVPTCQEADKTMIKTAKTFFSKAKFNSIQHNDYLVILGATKAFESPLL